MRMRGAASPRAAEWQALEARHAEAHAARKEKVEALLATARGQRTFRGTVTYVAPTVEEKTRTVQVRKSSECSGMPSAVHGLILKGRARWSYS